MHFRCDALAGLQQLEVRLNSAALQREQIWFLITRPAAGPTDQPGFLLITATAAERRENTADRPTPACVWVVDLATGADALAADDWQPAFLETARRGFQPGQPDTFVIVARRQFDPELAATVRRD